MPRDERLRLLRSVRKDRRLSDVPVIALSAVASPAAIERGKVAGFDDYVAKFDRRG